MACHSLHEEFLDRSHRGELCPNSVPEVLEGIHVFSWEDGVLGKEPVPERVETDGGFALQRLRSCRVESVRLIRCLLSFARHSCRLLLFSTIQKWMLVAK